MRGSHRPEQVRAQVAGDHRQGGVILDQFDRRHAGIEDEEVDVLAQRPHFGEGALHCGIIAQPSVANTSVIAIAAAMTLATRRTEIRFIVTMPPPISIERSALIGRLPS